jgi:soluble lytic murein transglycosylase-like protein
MRISKRFLNWINLQTTSTQWLTYGLGLGGLIAVAPLSGSDFSNHTQHQLSNAMQAHIQARLPRAFKGASPKISKTIEESALRHGLDPVMLLSLIEVESRFKPTQIGKAGEIGLMQIKPSTAAWVVKKFKMPRNMAHRLHDPIVNIQIGTRYLSYLRDRFNFQASTYLTAYNHGITRVILKERNSPNPQRTPASLESNYSRKIYKKYLEMLAQENQFSGELVAVIK